MAVSGAIAYVADEGRASFRALAVASALVIATSLLAGCGDDDKSTKPPPPAPSDAVVLVDSLTGLDSVHYEVEEGRISADTLILKVTVSGGCADHVYTLYIDRHFLEPVPVRAEAALVHVSEDPCDGILHHERRFHLEPLLEHYRQSYGGALDPIDLIVAADDRGEGEPLVLRFEP